MHSENNELVKAGHELAKCLDSNTPLIDIAKMIVRLADKLDVTTAALREKAAQCEALAAENASLKSNLMFWDADDPEIPYEHPDEIAGEYGLDADTVFDVQVAARLPDRKYRVVTMTDDECRTEQVSDEHIQTPATDAFLREVRASAVDAVCLKISNSIVSCRQDEMIGLDEAVNIASDYATELRQGGAA
ncbi:hypothetical protein [Cronobacter sakazakii]|uniref:hypothetical protein n=1 Tax=Cronobacter sakazakii TaxID=28141 RepID=UPI000CFCAC7C|nr:hypothetical protein [Cronobacter sakazakii]